MTDINIVDENAAAGRAQQAAARRTVALLWKRTGADADTLRETLDMLGLLPDPASKEHTG